MSDQSSATVRAPHRDEASPDHSLLTARQELIWLEHRLAPSAPANIMVGRFDVPAAIDEVRFADAFQALVDETDALRTVFEDDGSRAGQRVRESVVYRVPFVDLSSEVDPGGALDRFLSSHAPIPMDLGRRAFDAALVRLAPEHHVVILRQHHIITDATSYELLFRRLGELYDRRPGPATAPFAAYIEREQVYRASPDHARDARFWEAREKTAPPAPTFYGNEARERRGLVVREIVTLGPERTARLRAAVESGPLALPMRDLSRHLVYATALFAWMARVTGQSRIAVGCPLANRRSRRLRQVVGVVMEQSPMMGEVRADDRFRDLHARLREDLMSLLPHARYCTRNPARQKVYEAVLNVHTVRYAGFAGAEVRGSITPALAFAQRWPEDTPDGAQAFSLTVWQEADTDVLAFDLNRDVFDAPLRARAIAHFLRMLDALLDDPDALAANLDLLSDEERAICFAPIVPAAPLPSVVESIAAQVARTPDRIAFRSREGALTYGELWLRAGGVARALADAGAERGDAIAIALDRSVRVPIAMLGILRAGCAYVPLDPSHPSSRIARILEDARPRMLITERGVELAHGLPNIDAAAIEGAELDHARIDPEDLAYVLFTSGSSGRPKGVQVPHRGLSNFLTAFAHTPGMDADDRALAIATPAFDIHTVELLLPLSVGASSYIAEAGAGADGPRLRAILEAEDITVMQATPPTWRVLIDSGWTGDPGLKALIGAEPLPPDLAAALLERVGSLWNLYGPTETTVWATAHRVTRAESPASIGRPIERVTVRVLDDAGMPAPLGVEGEIWIGGAGMTHGYRNRPDLTAASFLRDADGHLVYRTGDRGRFRPDGTLECLGRRDGQVKVRGLRVELGEIEAALREHPSVSDAAVLFHGEGADARLVAHVAQVRGHDLHAGELRAHAAERLPAYMVPARWKIHDALPLGPTGKIDRRALADEHVVAIAPIGSGLAPRNDVEATLASMWAQALDLPSVGVDDDFFDLGGHSLLAARLVDDIRATFGVELPIVTLFTARTIVAVAERIAAGGSEPLPACVLLSRAGPGVPLFCICGVQVYHSLATRLGGERPVYGVYLPIEEEVVREAQAGRTAELSVDRMARAYVEVIRDRQPRGPYALAGLSFGGLLAYEIAHQLRAQGEEVAFVGLIDSVLPHSLHRDPLPWIAAQAKGIVRSPGARLRSIVGRPSSADPGGDASTAQLRERAYVAAMRRYRSRPYDGEVLLFRASDCSFGEGWRFDRDGGFSRLAPRLRILDVPGTHLSVLQAPHVDVLAKKVRPFLRRIR